MRLKPFSCIQRIQQQQQLPVDRIHCSRVASWWEWVYSGRGQHDCYTWVVMNQSHQRNTVLVERSTVWWSSFSPHSRTSMHVHVSKPLKPDNATVLLLTETKSSFGYLVVLDPTQVYHYIFCTTTAIDSRYGDHFMRPIGVTGTGQSIPDSWEKLDHDDFLWIPLLNTICI